MNKQVLIYPVLGLLVLLAGCGKNLEDCSKLTDPAKVFQCNARNFQIIQEKQEEFKKKAAEEMARTGAATQTIKEMNEWTEKMKAITGSAAGSKSSATFNSVYADSETGQYGMVAGYSSQNDADREAEKYCMDSRARSNCQKIYGDDLNCIAYATSSTGASGVGTADYLNGAKDAAMKWCSKSNNGATGDCTINEKSGSFCATK